MMSFESISEKAEGLLVRHGLLMRPIPIEKLAEQIGTAIHAEVLEDEVSGMLVTKGTDAHIIVNATHHANRQRFTLAHEIGHFILHHSAANKDQLFVDRKYSIYERVGAPTAKHYQGSESTTTVKQEREANAFAAGLLMPKILLEKYIEEKKLDLTDESDISVLAVAFGVSEQAMSIRVRQLGLCKDEPWDW